MNEFYMSIAHGTSTSPYEAVGSGRWSIVIDSEGLRFRSDGTCIANDDEEDIEEACDNATDEEFVSLLSAYDNAA